MRSAKRLLPTFLAFLSLSLSAHAADWQRFVDAEFGSQAVYPAHIFKALPPDPSIPGTSFVSTDGKAKLAIGSWSNGENESPTQFRDKLLSDARYATLTYRPRGRSWFVLSGFRGDKIYYEKVIYSCARRVVNAFAIMYPIAQRSLYDSVVERMEDHFRAGQDCR